MKKLLTFLLLAFIIFSCKENNPVQEPPKGLRLTEGQSTTLAFSSFAESAQVRFSADINWMIMLEDESIEWFTVSPEYGEAGENLHVSVNVFDYDGEENLSSSFKIVSGDQEVQIKVTQSSYNDPSNPYIRIEDQTFASYLTENFDTDYDGHISKEEATAITRIECNDLGITSIQGIEHMTSLEYLNCAYNTIKGHVDLSGLEKLEECRIDHNLYSSADLSGCSALKTLYANDNCDHSDYSKTVFTLEELNLDGCIALEFIQIEDNNLTELDLSDCSKLKTLRATWNSLETLDVSSCPDLEMLLIRKNPLTGTIDLSNCSKLQQVACSETELTGLTLTEHPALTDLDIANSKISSIDLNGCPALKNLLAHATGLTSIDFSNNPALESIWLKFNNLTSVDVTGCPNLKELQMGLNRVTELDLSQNPKLRTLEAANNGLTSIDLTGCSALVTASIFGNNLSQISLADCSSLEQFDISENNLTSLDMNGSPKLIILNCCYNEISVLNIDSNLQMTNLWADNNKIATIDLTAHTQLQEIDLHNNELTDISIAGLPVNVVYLQNNHLERLNVRGCSGLSELYVQDNPLAYLSLYTCESLRQLDCRNTDMKSVDLSNNPAMAFLFAENNPQMETIYILKDAAYSALTCDEHVVVWYKDPSSYDDVESGNWGDEDLNPWA